MNGARSQISVINRKQYGAILPIVAILALTLLAAITILAIDTLVVKDAQRRLRSSVDAICSRVAPLAVNQKKAIEEFNSRIDKLATTENSSFLRRTKIRAARILIPTMPQDGSFTRSLAGMSGADSGVISPNPCTIPSEGYVKCFTNDVTSAALNHNDVPRPAYSLFPYSTLTNSKAGDSAYNAGMTIGCEVVAEVERLFPVPGGERNVPMKVKSLWWIPVRAILSTQPGLTIAIAPELATNAAREEFRFVSTSASGAPLYQASFRENYDPLKRLSSNSFSENAFKGGADQSLSSSALENDTIKKLSADFTITDSRRDPPCNDPSSCSELSGTTTAASNLEDVLSACTNPPVLLRNLIVSTIVELASRHGQLRDSTEVLVVSPEGQQALTPPAIISRYGDDIAQSLYQIPYVLSRQQFSGASGEKWGDPFGSQASQEKEHMRLFSQQLRNCYHIYDQITFSQGGFPQGGISRYLEPELLSALGNELTDPPLYNSTYNRSLRENHYLANSGDPLDQISAWSKASLSANTIGNRLTVAQVVSALGTIQRCPAAATYCSGSSCAPVCDKPSTPDADLKPDLSALFRYLSKDPLSTSERTRSQLSGSTPAFIPALVEPGILPFNQTSDDSSSYPVAIEGYGYAESVGTHVLLVLHTLPNDLSQLHKSVSAMSTGVGQTLRPVTVIYIPTDNSSAAQGTIARLKLALTAIDETGSVIPQIIPTALYIIAPPSDEVTPLTSEDFIRYWHKLLTEEDDNQPGGESAVAIAQSIFINRILRLELRL